MTEKNRNSEEIEAQLKETLAKMTDFQMKGNYIEAENNRKLSEQLKKDLQARRIYQMEQKHARERQNLKQSHEQQLKTFNAFWEKSLNEYAAEGDALVKNLQSKHEKEIENMSNEMEKQLPFKVKESTEYLNLKKMEEHMAKQKIYTEAHKVQQRLIELEKVEKEAWIASRNLKIETAINTHKAKQAIELNALKKKLKSGYDEKIKEKNHEESRLNQKYLNNEKQLRGNQDKELLAFKGQFRSKGGQGSPLLLSKSKLTSSH